MESIITFPCCSKWNHLNGQDLIEIECVCSGVGEVDRTNFRMSSTSDQWFPFGTHHGHRKLRWTTLTPVKQKWLQEGESSKEDMSVADDSRTRSTLIIPRSGFSFWCLRWSPSNLSDSSVTQIVFDWVVYKVSFFLGYRWVPCKDPQNHLRFVIIGDCILTVQIPS